MVGRAAESRELRARRADHGAAEEGNVSDDLRSTVRTAVETTSKGGPATAIACAESVRSALAARGLGPNCHLDHKDHASMTSEETLEWYAGQFLDIVDSQSWFAMNSFINCVDKFAPEVSP
jgi:hypothetical protein